MKVLYDREKDRGGVFRVVRGGARYSLARNCRAARRSRDAASWRYRDLGFRPIIRIRRLG